MSSLISKLEGLLKSSSVAGIECILSSDGIREINYVVLKKEKNRLVTGSSGSKLKDIDFLKKDIPAAVPVFLVLNGRGIIHRKLSAAEGENDIALLNKVLPAAAPSDFYLQKVRSDEGSQFVSVIRKSAADEVLNNLKKNGFHVISCSLGPFSFQSMMPLLDNTLTPREVIVSEYKLGLGVNEISNFEPAEGAPGISMTLLGGEEIKPEQVVPFASAVQYFLSHEKEVRGNIASVAYAREEFSQKQVFRFASGTAIALFLAALLVNFFLFSSFSKKYNEYSTRVSANQNLVQQYEKLKAEVEQKQAFLEKTGLLEASRTSFYADRIAKELPVSIKLTRLNIFPLERKSNADEEDMTFVPRNIFISGTCRQSIELNEWMGMLKKTDWIKEVSILNFSQDKSENTGNFSIEIKMK